MVSAAERLAQGINIQTLAKASDLKKRLAFVAIALIVYRLGTFIPIPGINANIFQEFMNQNAGGLLGIFNMFSGGALGRMTIFALSIMPYINASIIMLLLSLGFEDIKNLRKEGGEQGRRKFNQYTRYLTVAIATFQAFGISVWLETISGSAGQAVLAEGWIYRLSVIISLVGGAMLLMWLGEQMTSRGIGNGISLIVFAGIVAEFPSVISQMMELGRKGVIPTEIIILIFLAGIALLGFIVFMERAQRRVLVQYPKRQIGNKLYGGESSHIPIKINPAGVLSPILASVILTFPLSVSMFAAGQGPDWLNAVNAYLGRGQPVYIALFVVAIVFFAFFLNQALFNPQEVAENLRKNGGYVPGIRPGKNTEEHFHYVLTRLTLIGALYLAFVCVLPEFLISSYAIPIFGGTSLLIIVSVTLDTVGHIQSHLFAHQYEGLMKKAKLKGRQGRR